MTVGALGSGVSPIKRAGPIQTLRDSPSLFPNFLIG